MALKCENILSLPVISDRCYESKSVMQTKLLNKCKSTGNSEFWALSDQKKYSDYISDFLSKTFSDTDWWI